MSSSGGETNGAGSAPAASLQPAVSLRVGDPAPTWECAGVDGTTGEARRYCSEEFVGSPLLLVFYPADNSPVCTQQLIEHTAGIQQLLDRGANLVTSSPQGSESHREFADQHGGFRFPMLCDVDLALGAAFGVLGLLGHYRRSTILVNAEGTINYVQRSVGSGTGFKPLAELLVLLDNA